MIYFKVVLILCLTTVMARIEPIFHRNIREAIAEPHRRSYSHSHYHRGTRNRGLSNAEIGFVKAGAILGTGLILGGLLLQNQNGK